MLSRVILIFLIGMVALAIWSRFRRRRINERQPRQLSGHKCPDCGTWLIGRENCPCGGQGKG